MTDIGDLVGYGGCVLNNWCETLYLKVRVSGGQKWMQD
jgi:hypothetical protein